MARESFTRHTLSVLVGRLALPVGAFLILIVIGRLSDQLLGEYALVTTYYFVLQTLPLLGLMPFYMREVARAPAKAGTYFHTFALMAVAASIAINILVSIGIDQTHYSPAVVSAIRIAAAAIVPGILAFLAEITLISLHRSRQIARIAVAENLLRVIASVAVVYIYKDVVSIIWVLLITRSLSFALYMLAFRRESIAWIKSGFDFQLFSRARKVTLVFLLNSVLALALSRLDFILLSFFESVVVIGYYAIGYRLFEIASIAMSAIQAAFFPRLSRTHSLDKSKFVAQLRLFLPALLVLVSLVSVTGFWVAEPYVRILFANQYPQPVLVSQLFMLLLVVHGADQTFSQALNAIDQQSRDTQAIALGVPIYAALLLLLIPAFGMMGAFSATSITLLFQASVRFYLLRRSTGQAVFSNRELLGVAMSFVSVPIILLSADMVGWWQQVLTGLLAFVVAVVILAIFGLVKPMRALSYAYAREGKRETDVASFSALLRFLAYDNLRFSGWWRRKLRNGSSVRNLGFAAVFLLRISRYLLLAGWPRLSRFVWQLNTIVSKSDIRPAIQIGPGFVIDGNAIGITGDVGHSVSVFAHTALGKHGELDIGAGPGLPVVGNHVVLSPRAYVLGPLKVESGMRIGAHARLFRRRQVRQEINE